MPSNFPGPYQIRLFYSIDAAALPSVDHVLQLNCDPTTDPPIATDFSLIALHTQAGGTYNLATAVDALVAVLQPLLSVADTVIDRAELWKFEDVSFLSSYVSSYPIADVGSAGPSAVPAGQSIYTFRTAEGGYMKVFVQEPVLAQGESILYADLGVGSAAFVDFFLATASNVWLGRDTSYPLVFHKLHPGSNEALFKARFR